MKLVMKTFWQLLMKKMMKMWKSEWWRVKEVTVKKLNWLKKANKMGINEVIKSNEIINNSFKP